VLIDKLVNLLDSSRRGVRYEAFARFREKLRDEPQASSYVAAAFVDDVGVALSVWATQWMLTEVFTDQRKRATFMIPMLACFLFGGVLAGPLADWSGRFRRCTLARWRWRTILFGRAVETVALAYLAVRLFHVSRPTVEQVLPYFLVSALMKTGLRPTRTAFEVDLLRCVQWEIDSQGRIVADDLGNPRPQKTNLLLLTTIVSALGVAATLTGLVVGGSLLSVVRGQLWKIFAADILTTTLFLVVFGVRCRPGRVPVEAALEPAMRATSLLGDLWRRGREAVSFLRGREQRPLVWLLALGWLTEVITEFYDGRMILRHELGGTEAQVRLSQIGWSLASLVVLAFLPAIAPRLRPLGRMLLLAVLADGVVLAVAGHFAAAHLILPFSGALCVDHALTDASSALVLVAQNNACRASIRGRVAAAYALVVIFSDIAAEAISTALSLHLGIPRMVSALGLAQVICALLVVLATGRQLWDGGTVGWTPKR
jgi:hypothetical protein